MGKGATTGFGGIFIAVVSTKVGALCRDEDSHEVPTLEGVIYEAIGIGLAFGLAGFCAAARAALDELPRDEVARSCDGEDEEATKVTDTFDWWRLRHRAVAMVLGLGHRLGMVAAVVLTLMAVGRAVQWSTPEVVGFVVAITLVAVIVCDVIPDTLARAQPKSIAYTALRLLRIPYLLLYPLVRALLSFRSLFVKAFGEHGEDSDSDQQQVRMIWKRFLARGDAPTAERRRLMRTVVESPGTIVREVMIPRTDMVVLSRQMDLDQILVVLLECGHSRIPVHGESLDDIEGFFYAKDIIELMASGRDFEIDDFLREPYFVPETKPISELLTEFQRDRIHLAVVVDEFGGTAGLITLEDIIEEFFGDIQDEYDVEPSQLIELSDRSVMADARISIDEIEEFFDVTLPRRGEYDSLGGFLLEQAGAVPAVGEEILWEELCFRVMEATDRRIDTVEIERPVLTTDEPTELVS